MTKNKQHKYNTNTTGLRVVLGFEETDMTRIQIGVALWASAVEARPTNYTIYTLAEEACLWFWIALCEC